MSILKIYLAGPDVFEQDARSLGEEHKELVRSFGWEPLFPMDNDAPEGSAHEVSKAIYLGNQQMIRGADIVIANLNAFRGFEPDSGTVWEIGFAAALGKRIIAYMADGRSMVARGLELGICSKLGDDYIDIQGRKVENFSLPLNLMLSHSIERVVVGKLKDALDYLQRTPARD